MDDLLWHSLLKSSSSVGMILKCNIYNYIIFIVNNSDAKSSVLKDFGGSFESGGTNV